MKPRNPDPRTFPAGLVNSALQHLQAGRLDMAEQALRQVLTRHPDDPDSVHLLGIVALHRRKWDGAEQLLRRATKLNPHEPAAWNNYGVVLRELQKLPEAVAAYRKALAIDPKFADALCNLGGALNRLGRQGEAIPALRRAISLLPKHAEALNNLASALLDQGELREAELLLRRALEVAPRMGEAWNNLGNLLTRKEAHTEAVGAFRTALQSNPQHVEAAANLGVALHALKRVDEAIAALQRAIELRPGYGYAEVHLLQVLQNVCDWDRMDKLNPQIDAATGFALQNGRRPNESPFLNVSRCDDPAVNAAVAKAWADEIVKRHAPAEDPFVRRAKPDDAPIVLGYLSSDLGEHAVGHLMRGQFRQHDRSRFRVHIYSTGLNDSAHNAQVSADSDKHVHIDGLEPQEIASLIRKDEIDILVHLNGWTKRHNLAVCALRAAPIQVEHLGFPGTTGAPFMDYAIVDPIVVPPEHAAHFTEKLVYLPHCYQSNFKGQVISERSMDRAEWGLPSGGIVFASFNQSYKFDRTMFGVWMRLLAAVHGSVLWLLDYDVTTQGNLKRVATDYGIEPHRLIFAPVVSKAEHLRRIQLVDVCLDTRIYTGHTTTSDALWAGVPVVALQGKHFASRVSASCLTAMGMADLVTENLETYESLAMCLATDRTARDDIRRRIEQNRLAMPLFDTPRFVRDLERAYLEMWEIHRAGKAPQQITISD